MSNSRPRLASPPQRCEAGEAIADGWSEMRKLAQAATRQPAAALHHDLVLVIRNDEDLAGTGVRTLNPWL
jgi:hypothetical protein